MRARKGKTAGRGTKGTKARYQVPAGFEGGQMPIHMRLPKLKGFKNRFRVEYQVVNVAALAALFPEGGTVGVDELVDAGAVRKGPPVKVLGNGDLGVKLDITAHAFSGQRPGEDHRRRRHVTAALSPSCSAVSLTGPVRRGSNRPTATQTESSPQEDPCSARSRRPSGRPTCARSCCSRSR